MRPKLQEQRNARQKSEVAKQALAEQRRLLRAAAVEHEKVMRRSCSLLCHPDDVYDDMVICCLLLLPKAVALAALAAAKEQQQWARAAAEHVEVQERARAAQLAKSLEEKKRQFAAGEADRQRQYRKNEIARSLAQRQAQMAKQQTEEGVARAARQRLLELDAADAGSDDGGTEEASGVLDGDDEATCITAGDTLPRDSMPLQGSSGRIPQLDRFNTLVLESLRRFYLQYDPGMIASIPDAVAMLGGNPKNFALLCANLETQYGARPIDAVAVMRPPPFDQQVLASLTEFYGKHDPTMVQRVPDVVLMLASTPETYSLLCDNLGEQYGSRPRDLVTEGQQQLQRRTDEWHIRSSRGSSTQSDTETSAALAKFAGGAMSFVGTETVLDENMNELDAEADGDDDQSDDENASSRLTYGRQSKPRRKMSQGVKEAAGAPNPSALSARRLAFRKLEEATGSGVGVGHEGDESHSEASHEVFTAPAFVRNVIATLRTCVEAHEAAEAGQATFSRDQWQRHLEELSASLDTLQYTGGRLGLPDTTLDTIEEQLQAMMSTIEETYLAASDNEDMHMGMSGEEAEDAARFGSAEVDRDSDSASLSSAASPNKHVRLLEARVRALEQEQARLQTGQPSDSSTSGDFDDDDASSGRAGMRYSEAGEHTGEGAEESVAQRQFHDVAIHFVERAHDTLRLCAEAHVAVVAGAETMTPDDWLPHQNALNSHLDAVQSGSLPLPKPALEMLEARLVAMIMLIEDNHVHPDPMRVAGDAASLSDSPVQTPRGVVSGSGPDGPPKSAADLFAEVKKINSRLREPRIANLVSKKRWRKYLKRIGQLVEFLASDSMGDDDLNGLAAITPVLLPQLANMTKIIKDYLAKAETSGQRLVVLRNSVGSNAATEPVEHAARELAVQASANAKSVSRQVRMHNDKGGDESDADFSPAADTDSIFVRGIRNALAQCTAAHQDQVTGRCITSEKDWQRIRLQLQLFLGDLRDEAQNLAPVRFW